MEDILETVEQPKQEVPQAVKTLSILAYVGNGFWGLMMIIIMFWIMGNIESLSRIIPIDAEIKGQLIVGMIVGIGLCVLPIIGAYQMSMGKKMGFWLYAVGNGIWVLMLVASGQGSNIVIGLISAGFIAGFASQLKFLK